MALGAFGVRTGPVAGQDTAEWARAAAVAERLGFGTIWIPGSDLVERARAMLGATDRLIVATSVINIWQTEPQWLVEARAAIASAFPGRFLAGIGVGHAPLLDPGTYQRPVAALGRYLDALDAAPDPVPMDERIVAALWPRSLELARQRALGSHPYLVNPTHTRMARELLGEGPVLAPAQVVVLAQDAARGRELARRHLNTPYLALPNYARNLLRIGFDEHDIADGGSDHLVDSICPSGDPATLAGAIRAHLDAGASHVALYTVTDDRDRFPTADDWRTMARELGIAS